MMITSFHHSSNFIFLYRMFRWLTHLFCNIQRKIFFLCMLFLRFYYDENVLSFLPTPPEILKESLWCCFFSLHLLNFLNIYSACVFAYEVWVMERKKLVYLSFLNSSIMFFFSLKKEAFIWKLVTLRVELFVSYHLVCKRIVLIHSDLYSIQSNSY